MKQYARKTKFFFKKRIFIIIIIMIDHTARYIHWIWHFYPTIQFIIILFSGICTLPALYLQHVHSHLNIYIFSLLGMDGELDS